MSGFALFAALFAAQGNVPSPAAEAQPAPSDIVVQGVRERKQQIRQFVQALSDAPNVGQIGKFHSPVCPAVIGFPAAQGQLIADRMMKVAEAAGIKVGKSECAPNVFLIATTDKPSTIKGLYSRYPAYFRDKIGRDVRKMEALPEPAVAWQVKGRVSADGTELKKTAGDGYYINEGTNSGSRVRAGTMPSFVASIVVVDRDALGGLSVTQVADYAAMRAFADTDPRRAAEAGAPTILTALTTPKDQPVPITLTKWDLGYLKSLYATSNAYYASYQRGSMEHVLAEELAKSGEGDR